MLRTIASSGLYLAAFVLFVEFFYLLFNGLLSINYTVLTILASLILFFLGLFLRKYFKDRFARGSVSKFLTLFIAFALVISSGKYLFVDYQYAMEYASKNLDNFNIVHFVITYTPIVIGIFFLIMFPVAILMELGQKDNFFKLISKLLTYLIFVFIFFLVISYGKVEFSNVVVNTILIPFINFVIGSFFVGWFYELFIGSLLKEE